MKAEPALASEAERIIEILEGCFDPFKEQLPFALELENAAAQGRVLVVRDGPQISGLLYFEVMGMTSILRYWLVRDEYRNQGIGAALMDDYIAKCPGVKRFVLWVLDDNTDAITKYRHYGFNADSLIDIVMIQKGDEV